MTIHGAVNLSLKRSLANLHFEDYSTDAGLDRSKLNSEKIAGDLSRVETRADFVSPLERVGFALNLDDYLRPEIDGRAAREIASQIRRKLPCIFLCDVSCEHAVIELVRASAMDYLFKPELLRLVPVIRRAAHGAETQSELGVHV
jgi:DNA-binding NtrC family response regulator